jgi:predicted dehydrogenase
MSRLTRREFITRSMAVGAGLAMAPPTARVLGANDDIRLAVVGVGGQGHNHLNMFSKIEGVRIVAICDPDQAHLDERAADFEKNHGVKLKTYRDVRQLLDDKEIDAISSATPNHWHSLVTVLACQAGKDVYIEKPASHEIWEGRKMVEAARKYNRIVQVGTQRRSSEAYRQAIEWIHQGNLGAIKWVRGFCYKLRASIGKVNGPQPIPASVDYNLWCGPADMEPLMREKLHYDWHWVWNTGNGDIGNQGIHEMDLARWALGELKLAPRVMSVGGRFGYDDDANTPNTLISFFDYKPAPLIFEVHGLPRSKLINKAQDIYRGISIGIVVQCENGFWAAGEGGGKVYDNQGNTINRFTDSGGEGHQANFIKAVRSRKVEDLNADIEKGHISSALCHMGNISYRLGKTLSADEIKENIKSNADLADSFERMLAHLQVNEVDIAPTGAVLGPMLTMDPEPERFTGDYGDMANMFLKRNYREPFIVPDKV